MTESPDEAPNNSKSTAPPVVEPPPRWGWKDWVIGGLALLVALLGGVILTDRLSEAGFFARQPQGDPVSVFDVVPDRRDLAYIDILFDRPLGEGREGEILSEPPATLSPTVGGVWRWRDAAALRFEPSDRLRLATEYTLALIPERLLGEGQVLVGPSEFSVTTDQFLVETVDVQEEPAPGAGVGSVVYRGEIRFNYAVDPRELATRVRLVDPAAGSAGSRANEGTTIETFFETTWPAPVVGFRTAPVTKRPDERALVLTVGAELTPAEGNVPLGEDFTYEILVGSSERLAVRGLVATPGEKDSTLVLTFSSPVSAQAAQGAISARPAVTYRVSSRGNQVVLTGGFVPGEAYRLSVAQGLTATDGAVLQEGWEQEARLANLEPALRFTGDGMFLSARGARSLGVETVNIPQIEVTVDRVYRNNLFSLFQYQRWQLDGNASRGSRISRALGDRVGEAKLKVESRRNRWATTPLRLDRFISGSEPGLYRVAVARPGEWQAEQRWVLITDLGLVAKKTSAGELVAWVFSFADLSPRAGVEVRLVSDQNQLLARGISDAGGRVRLGGEAVREGQPYLLFAELGDDLSFLFFEHSGVDLTGLDVAGATPADEGYDAFLYGERDLYRPGEVVEGVAVVRDRQARPAPAMPVVLAHRDPSGQERDSQRLAVGGEGVAGEQGLVPFRVEIPAYARTGFHSLELRVAERVIGTYRFQVEEFLPDRIKVEITPGEGVSTQGVSAGGKLGFQVRGAYLFGPPASGLAVSTRVRLEAAPFLPQGYEGFSFNNPERAFEGLELLSESTELDAAGRRDFSLGIPPGLAPPSGLAAVITARVQERGGRGVTALERVPVHPYPYYLGLRRLGEGHAEPGEESRFAWVAVAPSAGGAPAEARAGALRVEIFRDRWNTVLRRTPEGGVRYESVRDPELVETLALSPSSTEGSGGSFAFTPKTYGAYRVAIHDLTTGASTQVSFYAAGWGYSPWAIESPGRVELDLDRDEYAPGEVATVQVRAPFPGKLLLTVEGGEVLETRVETLEGNTASLPITVRAAWRPNVYITATLLRAAGDLRPGGAGRAFGAVPLTVDRSEKKLPVAIEVPGEMRPENPLTVRVRTAPGAAVTVAAVDEGILRLIGQETPDPFAHFYRKLALGVRSYDTFALLFPELVTPSPGGGEPGEGRAQYISTASMLRLEPAAFWSGVLRADARGVVEARFDIPPFQGQLRVMAVAIHGDRFGSEEQAVTVRDRLVVLPTLPRFLQLGDRLEIPVTLRNDTGRSGEVDVEVAWTAPGGEERSETTHLEVADGSEATTYLPLAMGDTPGVVPFTVTARARGAGAERTRARAALPLRPVLPPQRRQRSGAVRVPAAGTTLDLGSPAAALRPETVTRTLVVGELPLLRFGGRLSELLLYPYGCLEQTVSRVFPLLYLADLARLLEPSLFEQGSPEVLIEDGLARIAALQLPNGGFAMWPEAPTAEPWVSLYATHLLVEAREAGHATNYSVEEQALRYTARSVSAKARYGSGELRRAAYALYILSRAGRADLGTMDFLREKHSAALDASSRALLAAAYAEAGNPRAAGDLAVAVAGSSGITTLLDEIDRADRRSRDAQSGGDADEVYASALRDRALLLLALTDALPKGTPESASEAGGAAGAGAGLERVEALIPQLVDRLAREAEAAGAWTTQEAGFALVALGRLVQVQQKAPPVTGATYLGQKSLGRVGGGGPVVFRELSGTAPLRIELAPAPGGGAGGQAAPDGSGPGRVFYSLVTRGVPTEASFRPTASGLEIERTFLSREGRPVDLDAVRQGDLLVIKTRVRSTAGPVSNVVISNLLPPGLEVENPRLRSSETLPWITDADLHPAALDLRDDRVLAFADLPASSWRTLYTLVRAVVPGTFGLPPASVEAMYSPSLHATGAVGEIRVRVRP